MTIAVSLKVHDGVVLAADSATTMVDSANPQVALNVYNNANKIFNLCKGRPLGMVTWGAGSIAGQSIATLAKDLRMRFAGEDQANAAWALGPACTVEDVAKRAREFLFEEQYQAAFPGSPPKPEMGFIVSGYSTTGKFGEEWRFLVDENGNCDPPALIRAGDLPGVSFHGQPEPVNRLVMGYSPDLPRALEAMGKMSLADAQALLPQLKALLGAPLVQSAMPIQDAIDLAEFFVHTAIQWSRFALGAQTVGGQIEIAAITRHEGFKWVRRKYWYESRLNP